MKEKQRNDHKTNHPSRRVVQIQSSTRIQKQIRITNHNIIIALINRNKPWYFLLKYEYNEKGWLHFESVHFFLHLNHQKHSPHCNQNKNNNPTLAISFRAFHNPLDWINFQASYMSPFRVSSISGCSRVFSCNHVETSQASSWSFDRQFFLHFRLFSSITLTRIPLHKKNLSVMIPQ